MSLIFRLPVIFALGIISGCSGDSNNANKAQSEDDEICQVIKSAAPKTSSTIDYFGDGSDGELYLGENEVFLLDERNYNFDNIYVEVNSILETSDQARDGVGKIVINSRGDCEFYGDFILEDYKGLLEINCYGTTIVASLISVPLGSVSFSHMGEIDTTDTSTQENSVVIGSTLTLSGSIPAPQATSIIVSSLNTAGDFINTGIDNSLNTTDTTEIIDLGSTITITSPPVFVIDGVGAEFCVD
ncbi:MAG: hypothetical protein ACI93R_001391 [Flavobacteriales bacterium]|jgi:hypothetical protein